MDNKLWRVKLTKTYTPIGKHFVELKEVDGVILYKSSDYSYVLRQLPTALAVYPEAKILSSIADHGHTNRDGEHTAKSITTYYIAYEQDYYSYEDNLNMVKERLAEKFANSKMFPVSEERAERIRAFRKSLGVIE